MYCKDKLFFFLPNAMTWYFCLVLSTYFTDSRWRWINDDYIDDHPSLNIPRYLNEVSVRLLYSVHVFYLGVCTIYGYSFASTRLRNWQISLVQYKRPHRIRVLHSVHTDFGQITEGRWTSCCSMVYILAETNAF